VTTTEAFLGVIALATLITAIAQVGVLIAGLRLARRVNAAVERIEDTTGPIVARVDELSAEALLSLAAARSQMDRLERMTEDVVNRIDETVRTWQTYVLKPARQGVALLAGARAAVLAFRRPPFAR
jgi:tetrahydromethanopterin S-methyltransferase subunit B